MSEGQVRASSGNSALHPEHTIVKFDDLLSLCCNDGCMMECINWRSGKTYIYDFPKMDYFYPVNANNNARLDVKDNLLLTDVCIFFSIQSHTSYIVK